MVRMITGVIFLITALLPQSQESSKSLCNISEFLLIIIANIIIIIITWNTDCTVANDKVPPLDHEPGAGNVARLPPNIWLPAVGCAPLTLSTAPVLVTLFMQQGSRLCEQQSFLQISLVFRGLGSLPVHLQLLACPEHPLVPGRSVIQQSDTDNKIIVYATVLYTAVLYTVVLFTTVLHPPLMYTPVLYTLLTNWMQQYCMQQYCTHQNCTHQYCAQQNCTQQYWTNQYCIHQDVHINFVHTSYVYTRVSNDLLSCVVAQ